MSDFIWWWFLLLAFWAVGQGTLARESYYERFISANEARYAAGDPNPDMATWIIPTDENGKGKNP